MNGDNMTVKVDGKTVTITFDASKDGNLSSSGKTYVVASSRGALQVEAMGRKLSIGLNVFSKQEKVERAKLAKVS